MTTALSREEKIRKFKEKVKETDNKIYKNMLESKEEINKIYGIAEQKSNKKIIELEQEYNKIHKKLQQQQEYNNEIIKNDESEKRQNENTYFDYNIFFENFTDEEKKYFMVMYEKLNCYTLLKYIKKIQDTQDIKIIKLTKINPSIQNNLRIGNEINHGSYGTIYSHGLYDDLVIKEIINTEKFSSILFLVIILNVLNMYKLVPEVKNIYYETSIYNYKSYNKIDIIMAKYTSNLKIFFNNIFEDKYRDIVYEQISKLLLRLYKLNLICADIKLLNIVINYENKIDIKLIDIEMDFCDCLNNKHLNYDNALLFVNFYLHLLNLQSKDKLLKLGDTYKQFYKLLYDFLLTFDEYFIEITDYRNDFIDKPILYYTDIIELDEFSNKSIDEKKLYLNLDLLTEIDEKKLYCIYLKCKFKYTLPLKYYLTAANTIYNI
jgi:hypothetical protein